MSVSMKPGVTQLTVTAARRQLARERLGEADEARPWPPRTRPGRRCPLADHRRDVDDAAGLRLQEVARRRLAAVERARQVDVERPLPVFLLGAQEQAVDGDAGVVDEHVEPPVLLAICLIAASTAAASATSKRASAPWPPASLIVCSVSAAAASFAV